MPIPKELYFLLDNVVNNGKQVVSTTLMKFVAIIEYTLSYCNKLWDVMTNYIVFIFHIFYYSYFFSLAG